MPTAGEIRPDCEFYGPTRRAHASRDETRRAAPLAKLEALCDHRNKATDGGAKCDGEYLEVIAVRDRPRPHWEGGDDGPMAHRLVRCRIAGIGQIADRQTALKGS